MGERTGGGRSIAGVSRSVEDMLKGRLDTLAARPSLAGVLDVVTAVQWAARRGFHQTHQAVLARAMRRARTAVLRLDGEALREGKPAPQPPSLC